MKTLITIRNRDIKNSYAFKNKNIFLIFIIMMSAVFFVYLTYKSKLFEGIFSGNIELLNVYLNFIKNNSKPEVFTGLLLSAFVCYLSVALFSTSIIGAPLIYITVFFKVTGLGTLLFSLYSEYGLSGIEYSVLVLLPGKYLMLLSLLLLSDSSSRLCTSIAGDIKGKSEEIKKYIIILVFTALLMLISVIIDYFAVTVFAGLFDLKN